MVKTLKGLKAKVLRNPGNYGKGEFFKNGKPFCPIAVEIIPDAQQQQLGDSYWELAAKRLHCSIFDVSDFTDWWDAQ